MSFSAQRRRWLLVGGALLLVLVVVALWTARDTMSRASAPTAARTDPRPDSVLSTKEIARKAMAATVQIRALDALGTTRGDGTGFFVSADGLLATSLHVIRGAHSLEIQTLYGTRYDTVHFVAADARRDLAILKVNVADAPALPLAGGTDPDIGEPVFVTGNPLGQTGTFSNGLVSARRAAEGITFIQISAPIAPGSSGGPVMNDRGQVLGVTTLRLQRGQNLNYAVPVRYLKRLLDSADESVRYARVLLPKLQRPPVLVTDATTSQVGHLSNEAEPDVIVRQLAKSDSVLRKLRGTPDGETIKASVAPDDSLSRTLKLLQGREYVMAGYCDEHCTRLSLSIKSPAGRVIDSDVDVDDAPKLRFVAPSAGSYTLDIVMSDCDTKSCRLGVRTYVLRPETSQPNRR